MPNEGMKISQLPAATEALDSDVVAGVGGGVTRKFTFATIASYIQTKLTALFAAKQDKITAAGVLQGDGDGGVTAKTVDSTPTASSTNLVTSGGVKSALDALSNVTLCLKGTLPNGTDLNDVTGVGVYSLDGGRNYLNYPVPTSTTYGTLEVMSGSITSSQKIQRLTRMGNIFFRYYLGSGSWGNWYSVTCTQL